MKMGFVAAALCLAMVHEARAENLCGVRDGVLARLAGSWTGEVTASVETEVTSVTEVATPGRATLGADGRFTLDFIEQLAGEGEAVTLALGEMRYDVDGVDDLFETTETAWMADALSDTRCGPEELPQLRGVVDYGDDLRGEVTLIAYFDDRVLMLSAFEMKGVWGIAFVTGAALLRPDD